MTKDEMEAEVNAATAELLEAARDTKTRRGFIPRMGHNRPSQEIVDELRGCSKDDGARQKGHPGFLAVLDEIRRLHLAKACDYGRGVDPLANLRASEEFGVPAWKATVIRLNDKMHRVKSLCLNGGLKNESVEDSFADICAYAALALVLYREWKEKQDATDPRQPGV